MTASAPVRGLACVAAVGVLTLSAAAGPPPAVSGPRPEARISEEQAIALAVNDLRATSQGFVLGHPRHHASFTAQGLRFVPRRGGPSWRWRFEGRAVRPALDGSTIVYRRGALAERYLPGAESIEQQFVLSKRPADRRDLVIAGRIESVGKLSRTPKGWTWATKRGAVRLGDVTVLDARGKKLPARMSVERDRTRIVVDGRALQEARYPVTVDPEIGANDFRISEMGSDNVFDAAAAAVAYNSTSSEYLVVWEGDDNTVPLVEEEFEIFGQRVDAVTGAEVGADFRISDMGPNGNADFDAVAPAAAYNATSNEFLVVWQGDDDTLPVVDEEFEIFGQRLDAAGAEIGTNDFRISDMGPDGSSAFGAFDPAVAFNGTDMEYLVVWRGDDDTLPLADNEFEIFGQRLDTAGLEVGTNDFRISDMGPNGNTGFGAFEPAATYSGPSNEYLVAWRGDDNTLLLVNNEFEIFGQRLDAAGLEVGTNDFRISDMGIVDGMAAFAAFEPAITHNTVSNEYLVVWRGDDDTPPLVDNENEIFGQRLDAAGLEVGTNDFRISDHGADGDAAFDASTPAVAYREASNEYLVVWAGDDGAPLADNEFEIYGQLLDSNGAEILSNDFRISDMGPDGSGGFDAFVPAVAHDALNYLVVWDGDDNTAPLVDEDFEIFGQRLDAAGAEVGANDARLSDMGPDGTPNFDAFAPAVAYNGTDNEYLVVWRGDDDAGALADEEFEIFGQRLDAVTGGEVGANDFRISDMGPDGNAAYGAFEPAVAYSGTSNEYLVVWFGDDDTPPLVDNEFEIFGQRLDAAGVEIAPNDFRISDMGPDGNSAFGTATPAVAHNTTANEYLVVWRGDDDTLPLVDNEFEVFGQRLDAAGVEIAPNDFRISDMGPDGNPAFGAVLTAVAYNTTSNQYLVVWDGDDSAPLANGEFEIFGQLLDAAGLEIAANDFRISDMGPDGNAGFDAVEPAVAHNATANEYLVVWRGDDDTLPLVDNEFEVFGQRLDAAAAEIVPNDVRISDMGPDGSITFGAFEPAAAYDLANDDYLVVWRGDDDTPPLADNEFEIHGQLLDATSGAEVGDNDFRLSDMGPDGNGSFDAVAPAVAFKSTANVEYLVVWEGDDDVAPHVNDALEIFGQRFSPPATAVTLLSFAARRDRGGITLRWRTAQEAQLLGFHVYRQVGARRVRLDRSLISSAGRPGGHIYWYVDRSTPRGKLARYWLQAVDLHGTRVWFGPRLVRLR